MVPEAILLATIRPGLPTKAALRRVDSAPMAECTYCGHEAFNVIEVRYARTLQHLSTGVTDEDDTPREIIGRGYYVCDGCIALLDWHVEHHLDRRKHSIFNGLSAVYQLLVVWGAVAVWDLASTMTRIQDRTFLTIGLLLAFGALIVWFLRAKVHSDYYGRWRVQRKKPMRPGNSLGAFTDLRDRFQPELGAYLPVTYEDSLKLASLPGSPPIRSLGPNGEGWGEGPQVNFAGSGGNEWYRLVWISWRMWPLTGVLPPDASTGWTAPLPPDLHEAEVAAGTILAALTFTLLVLAVSLPWWMAILVAGIVWPAGFFGGKKARAEFERRQAEKALTPAMPGPPQP